MSSVPARVALLGIEGDVRAQLRQVLLDYGAQISIEADPRAVGPEALSEAGSSIIVVSLDESIEDALDAFRLVFDDPAVSVIFDDASVTRKLGGWELARWARHLASKISGDAAIMLPVAPTDANRLPSFDMRPQPGAPTRPDQEMSAATLSEYTHDTSDLAREVPALELPGGGEKMPYAPPYVRGDDSTAEGAALLLDDDEIERAMMGSYDAAEDLVAAPVPESVGLDAVGDEEIDFSTFVESQGETAQSVADGNDLSVPDADESYLETDFSFDLESASTESADAGTSGFAHFDDADDKDLSLDPELLALAAALDANTTDSDEVEGGVADPDFARRDPCADDTGGNDGDRAVDVTDAQTIASAPSPAAGQAQANTSLFANLELVSEDTDSGSPVPAHNPVARTEIDFDALIAGLSLADDDASTSATQHGAVIIFSGSGGPDGVRQILSNLPVDLPVPVVLIQHLEGANHDRLIPQLAKVSALTVVLAEAGKAADAGRVFVLPAAVSMLVGRHGNLSFTEAEHNDEALLAQLAAFGPDLMVAVVSGAPAVLAEPLAACVRNGAIVIGQDPASCFDATACTEVQRVGGKVGAIGELTAKAVERWAR